MTQAKVNPVAPKRVRVFVPLGLTVREKFVREEEKITDFQPQDITWMLHGYKNVPQAKWCLQNLRDHYPKSPVLLMVYGDMDPAWKEVAKQFTADLRQSSEQILALTNGAQVWQERFTVFLQKPTRWLFKLDVDTRINKTFSFLPRGEFAVITNPVFNPNGYWESILGGCVGFSRETVELFISSGAFLSKCFLDIPWIAGSTPQEQIKIWLDNGLIADDNVFNQARRRLGIPMVNHPEMLILGGGATPDLDRQFMRQFAVTHPHKDTTVKPATFTKGDPQKYQKAIARNAQLLDAKPRTPGTEVFFLSHDCWDRAVVMDNEAQAAGFKTTIIHIPIPGDPIPGRNNAIICNDQHWVAMWNLVVEKATAENVWVINPYVRLYDITAMLQRGDEVMEKKDVWQYSPFFDCFLLDTFSMLSLPQYGNDPATRVVPYNERSVICVKADLLLKVGEIDPAINTYGWGSDSLMGYIAEKHGKKCVRDYRVTGRLMWVEEWNPRLSVNHVRGHQEQVALLESFGAPHIDGECSAEVYGNRLFKIR